MRKKTSYFFSAKRMLEMLEYSCTSTQNCARSVLRLASKLGSCRQYRASLLLSMWSSVDSRRPVPWSPEERKREMTNIIAKANQKGAASTFYTYAPDDVHDHDVDVTRWASRGVAETVPLDSCTPRAMPSGLLRPWC